MSEPGIEPDKKSLVERVKQFASSVTGAETTKSLGAQVHDRVKQFRAALPAHMPPERFVRVVLTAIQNNPALAQADRPSLWNACMRAAQDGLLPDGRDGALVIYKTKEGDHWIDKVQWMPMIGGIRKKVRNSGEIKEWNAQVVHAKDAFEFELGDTPFIKHKPYLGGDPGPVCAAYSVAQFKSGELSREVMTRAEIDKVRSISKARDRGPWVDFYEEMCRKTVARRHAKSLPMSSDLDDLIRRDDDLYSLGAGSEQDGQKIRRQSLGDRLDALAGAIGHDPETGEISQLEESPAAATRADALAAAGGKGNLTDAGHLAALLATGDARAAAGDAALRHFLAELTETEAQLIEPRRQAWIATAARVDFAAKTK